MTALPTQLVPWRFRARNGNLPLSQLDADLDYVSGKALSVKDFAFGAKGDNAADDYAAIIAAIAAAQARGPGTRLYFPHGTYLHSSPIVITGTPIQLWGEGCTSAIPTFPATTGSTLRYTGAGAGHTAVTFKGMQKSFGMRAMGIDGNGADNSLVLDTVIGGVYDDLLVFGASLYGLTLTSNIANGSTCSYNAINNTIVGHGGATGAALRLTGNGLTNACHNSFHNLLLTHGAAADGIRLGACDNNRFFGTFITRGGGGTGYGVNVIPTEIAGFPVSNYFYHLEADGGWNQPNTQAARNFIFGYDQSNGQPAPVTNGTPLWYTTYDGIIQDTTIGVFPIGRYAHVGNGAATFFGRADGSVAANATSVVTTAGNGLYVIRNLTNGSVAIMNIDVPLGLLAVVSDPNTLVAIGADPGAGSSKFWVTVSGTSVVITNRFATTKGIGIAALAVQGTPQ